MDNKHISLMTPFDSLISTKSLRMMKLILPYTSPSNQRMLAVYVKFMELQKTMDFFKDFGNDLCACSLDSHKELSTLDMLEEMRPYLDEEEGGAINNMINMMNMMELVKSCQSMYTADDINDSSTLEPMALMKNFLTPEQQTMFDTYNTMFANNAEPTYKGDDDNE
ncbi:MAG: hypothetical protein RR275_07850 [Lachnospiraceae bacterium]